MECKHCKNSSIWINKLGHSSSYKCNKGATIRETGYCKSYNEKDKIKFSNWENGKFYINADSKHRIPFRYSLLKGLIYQKHLGISTFKKHDLSYNYLIESEWMEATND